MTTGDQMGAALAPGSIEYGKRKELEATLNSVAATRQGAKGVSRPMVPPPGQMGGGDDLLDMLTSGEVPPLPGLPITDGIPIGPGANSTPSMEPSSVPTPLEDRLRLVAVHAKSPHLRAMARLALRREVYKRVRPSG